MIIKNLTINGLNHTETPIYIEFNDDINIVTGRNGSGKTTVLKLLWYCVSGNIERAIDEIIFSEVIITTEKYTLICEKTTNSKDREFVSIILLDEEGSELVNGKEPINRDHYVDVANDITTDLLTTSIFFPTFRRIEGGFSMTDSHHTRRRVVNHRGDDVYINARGSSDIQDALEAHASRLSVGKHKFVSSISTVDIQQLVSRKHALATTKVDNYSKTLSDNIFNEIKRYRSSEDSKEDALKAALSTLEVINQDVVKFEQTREDAFQALTVLSEIIVKIFEHKGIRLNPRVALGDINHSINSEQLSAGEKQMLSFLCYNALYKNCPLFIDEPELSLHVDWQRILLDVMVEQSTQNQMFIATHSPFIYSQYPDKEIMIGSNRGDEIG